MERVGGNSLFGVRNLVLDSTIIISASTVGTSTLFVLGFDVVIAELTYLMKDQTSAGAHACGSWFASNPLEDKQQ